MQQKWKIVAMLFAIAALNYADRTAIASVFPLLRADLGLSDIMLAGIGSAFLWSYAIGSPIAGYLADRLSRTRMVLFSLVSWSMVMALTGFVHSSAALLVMRVLLGIAECGYLPASIALIADHHGPETRATAMGFQLAGINVGLISGGVIAGYLGEVLGWRVDFFILGGAGLFMALLASFVLSDTQRVGYSNGAIPDDTSPGWSGVWKLLRMPGYVAVILGALLISIATWVFLNWLPLYFYDRFHLSLAVAGLAGSSALQAAAMLGAVLGGYFSDRLAGGFPTRRMLLLAIGYFCAAPFLLIFLSKAPLGPLNVSIFLYSLIRGLGSANECPIISELAEPHLRSTAIGIFNMTNCIAGGVGILLAGFLKHDYGLGTTFGWLATVVASAGMVVFITYCFLVRQEHKSEPFADAVRSH